MKSFVTTAKTPLVRALALTLGAAAFTPAVFAQQVTFAPYIQLGDNGPLGSKDQIVVAWQTDETTPHPSAYKVEFGQFDLNENTVVASGRVVDNYLAADPALPSIPGAYGPHVNYVAVLRGLNFDSIYSYRVSGPGMPAGGFAAKFNTRTLTSNFNFVVVGDEGFFPTVPNSDPATIVDYEARIAHLINNASNLSVAGVPQLNPAHVILNTGDNVYNEGTEDSYRDFFFPVYNSDTDSNETGAPIVRSTLFFPTAGNHDLGSTGVSANLLADNSAPLFSGNLSGGDAMSYFNDFYFPQNGPTGFDIQNAWDVTTSTPTGFTFSYEGQNYNSPAAIAALRASTAVNTAWEKSTQIDHQSNYSFDYGNAHFLFLDANPHLFNDNLPSGSPSTAVPPTFVPYPTALGQWVINDLDSSNMPWKIVVYHQPAFTSGDATLVNNQMRQIAQLLEDHGVNVIFNGHDHNYQRSLPIRATSRTGATPSTSGGPAVNIDQKFDGNKDTVPDGVLYIVEGAGGNRDFDGDYAPPRGSGTGLDQDDSATGTFTEPGIVVPQGPASWLDTNLTNPEMAPFIGNTAGQGTKITAKLKAKVFSFGDVVVDGNQITLYQISEPLQASSSATSADPAPYGTDINGDPLNDPIPDTVVDPATGKVLSAPATGTSALLDKWSVTKPYVWGAVSANLTGPNTVKAGAAATYTVNVSNHSAYPLNGTQVRLIIPQGMTFAGTTSTTTTVVSGEIVVTLGRLAVGASQSVQFPLTVNPGATLYTTEAKAEVTSSTAVGVNSNYLLVYVK